MSGACGKPAFYIEGEFVECHEHAHQPGSLYLTRGRKQTTMFNVGDYVKLRAYGGTYYGRIVRTGPKRADVRITLQSGAEKVLKNKVYADLTHAEIV